MGRSSGCVAVADLASHILQLPFGRRDIGADLEPGVRGLRLLLGGDQSLKKRASLQRIPTPDPIWIGAQPAVAFQRYLSEASLPAPQRRQGRGIPYAVAAVLMSWAVKTCEHQFACVRDSNGVMLRHPSST